MVLLWCFSATFWCFSDTFPELFAGLSRVSRIFTTALAGEKINILHANKWIRKKH